MVVAGSHRCYAERAVPGWVKSKTGGSNNKARVSQPKNSGVGAGVSLGKDIGGQKRHWSVKHKRVVMGWGGQPLGSGALGIPILE